MWFSIYDGHGGNMCAQFLKDHLHQFFFKSDWKKDVTSAMKTAFAEAEAEWMKARFPSSEQGRRSSTTTYTRGDSLTVLLTYFLTEVTIPKH